MLLALFLSRLTGWTMSEMRTRSTLLGASFPGRRIASLERFVPSPPSNVPAEDDGGGLLFGLFIVTRVKERGQEREREPERGLFSFILNFPAPRYKHPSWFSTQDRQSKRGVEASLLSAL